MRIVFAGTAAIAVPSLAMLAQEHQLVGILTNPDAPQGRGLVLTSSPVAQAAQRLCPDIPLWKPERLTAEVRDMIRAAKPDVLVVYAYGKIFGPKFLSLFGESVNVHPSLLPRWRGPAPIAFSILNRDAQTGISIQKIAQQVDSGDIFEQIVWDMQFTETTAELTNRAAETGSMLLNKVLHDLEAGTVHAVPQNDALATHSWLLTKQDGIIDWNKSSEELHAMIRALNPWPLAQTSYEGKTLYIHNVGHIEEMCVNTQAPGTILSIDKNRGIMVQTGTGALFITGVQWAGKNLLPMKDFLNGARLTPGSCFS